jgi:lipopolysaccharide export system permease protein
MKLLDRYVLRNFLEPFIVCFGAFLAIWIIVDLSDNSTDFIDAKASSTAVVTYYLTQLPNYALVCMPVGLLLGLLYSLSRMSRSNELISMLTAGRSVYRVLVPIIGVGLVAVGVCLWLNWAMVPHSEQIQKTGINQIKRKKKIGEMEPINAHLFRDRQGNRTWFVRRLRPEQGKLDGVHISEQDAEGRIVRKWYADRAVYDPQAKTWKLERGLMVTFTPEGDEQERDSFPDNSRIIKDWSETPWRVSSSELDPQTLSVPELRDYLHFNSDFSDAQLAPYRANLADRIAQPVSCLVVVLFAAPLGIVFNRRGMATAVAAALFIFFGMIMARGLFMALGKGMRLDPFLAPWMPNIILGILGLILMWFRSTNRQLPSFGFGKK